MALDDELLRRSELPVVVQSLRPDDCILYALGVGAGLDPGGPLGDETQLLFEDRLEVLPSQASVLAYPGFWMREPVWGIDWRRVVHGEQRITLTGPLPKQGELTGRSRISAVADKGAGKGAIVVSVRDIIDAEGLVLARVEHLTFCRGDGGYSKGDASRSDPLPQPIPKAPDRQADVTFALTTSPQLAAIYRLSGDRNPLHIDSVAAREAGYSSPILHGAATLGLACRALEALRRSEGAGFMSGIEIRFSGVFFPGETLTVQVWRGDASVVFRCATQRGSDIAEVAFGQATWSPLP